MLRFFKDKTGVLLARTASCHARFFVGWTWFSSTLFVDFGHGFGHGKLGHWVSEKRMGNPANEHGKSGHFSHGSHGFPLDFPRFWEFSQHGFWGFRTVPQHQKTPLDSLPWLRFFRFFGSFRWFSISGSNPSVGWRNSKRRDIPTRGTKSLWRQGGGGLGWIGLDCWGAFHQVAVRCVQVKWVKIYEQSPLVI